MSEFNGIRTGFDQSLKFFRRTYVDIARIDAYGKFRSFGDRSRRHKSNRCLSFVRTLACRLHFSRMHDIATISHDTMENRIVTSDGKICVPPVVPIIEYTLD